MDKTPKDLYAKSLPPNPVGIQGPHDLQVFAYKKLAAKNERPNTKYPTTNIQNCHHKSQINA